MRCDETGREGESQYQIEHILEDSESDNTDQKWPSIKISITEVAKKCIAKKKKLKTKKCSMNNTKGS